MTTPDLPPATPPPVGPRPRPLAVVSIASLLTAVLLGVFQVLSPGKAGQLPSVLGTVAGWVSAGGIMGILSLLVWQQLGNRTIAVEESKVDNADKADIRDHYANEVAQLRAGVIASSSRHRDEMGAAEARHKVSIAEVEGRYKSLLTETEARYRTALLETEKAHEACKAEVQGLREELRGIRDQFRADARGRIVTFGKPGTAPSEAVVDAAERVNELNAPPPGNDNSEES